MAKKGENQKKEVQENKGSKELAPEDKQKIEGIKTKIEEFKKKVVGKFEGYIAGISLLPPKKKEEDEADKKTNEDDINLLVLVDDTDSKKMSKEELKEKLGSVIEKMAKETDSNLAPETLLLSELWQSCYDGKSEMLQMIAMGAIIHDTGMMAAIKISEVHKSMVLKKFEKYIVSYVLAGSLTQGKATKDSDIDVFLVIDDTDVKKMTRAELKDKLRAIIIGMGMEAGEATGIHNKLNIQVYILTDFWDSIKEANPVIFTFLRDGVPFYDRGVFMPWKQLLNMGKVKPSREAIEMYSHSGEQMLQRVKDKLKDIGSEDTYWAILTPSQAALMMYDIPPPTPRETPEVMREIFVKRDKILEEEYVKILERNIKIRKDVEHGTKKDLDGKEVDKLIKDAEKYLKRMRELFEQIEEYRAKKSIQDIYDTTLTVIRDAVKAEGVDKMKDSEVEKVFKEVLVDKGIVPDKFKRILKSVIEAKKRFEDGSLTKHDIEKANKDSRQLNRFLIEHIQRKRGRELERAKIRVKHGEKFGEIILLDDLAFIIFDVDSPGEVLKANITKEGSLGEREKSSLEEMEEKLSKTEMLNRTFIKGSLFKNIAGIFGDDVEISVNY